MTGVVIERRRTVWDIVWGILVVLAGLFILGHVAIATVVSVLFLGWFALLAGVFALVGALFRLRRGGFWGTAIGGGLLVVLGLMLLRNPRAGALALTLIAGSLFLAAGIVLLMAAMEAPAGRGVLIFNGAVSVILGLIVLFNIWTASLTLLGLLLGLHTIADGISMLLWGRVHARPIGAGAQRQRIVG
jgi:uncharacterized membrane protein HdeD (DUF308 family)